MSLEGDFDMQPLSRVKRIHATDWGHDSIMENRPAVAVRVAQCIAGWTNIEILLSLFLAALLHANDSAILAVYSGLENRAAQLRMLLSASQAALPTEHADLISVL